MQIEVSFFLSCCLFLINFISAKEIKSEPKQKDGNSYESIKFKEIELEATTKIFAHVFAIPPSPGRPQSCTLSYNHLTTWPNNDDEQNHISNTENIVTELVHNYRNIKEEPKMHLYIDMNGISMDWIKNSDNISKSSENMTEMVNNNVNNSLSEKDSPVELSMLTGGVIQPTGDQNDNINVELSPADNMNNKVHAISVGQKNDEKFVNDSKENEHLILKNLSDIFNNFIINGSIDWFSLKNSYNENKTFHNSIDQLSNQLQFYANKINQVEIKVNKNQERLNRKIRQIKQWNEKRNKKKKWRQNWLRRKRTRECCIPVCATALDSITTKVTKCTTKSCCQTTVNPCCTKTCPPCCGKAKCPVCFNEFLYRFKLNAAPPQRKFFHRKECENE